MNDVREKIQDILDYYDKHTENKQKVNSVFIFKKLYNSLLLKEDQIVNKW